MSWENVMSEKVSVVAFRGCVMDCDIGTTHLVERFDYDQKSNVSIFSNQKFD